MFEGISRVERIKLWNKGEGPFPRKSTDKAKRSGSYFNRFKNREARAKWQDMGSKATHFNFPFSTCNGKKYRKFR